MIETERLILRPFIMEDATDVFEYLNEPLVNCFACMKLNTIEESNKHLQEAIKYAKAFDELKDYEEHTSILVEGNEYKKEKTSRGDTKSHLDIINELLSE